MRHISISTRSAATRARRAAVLAGAFGVIGLAAAPAVWGGSSIALVVFGISLIGAFSGLCRHALMSDLAVHGQSTVRELAKRLPHVPPTASRALILSRAHELMAAGDVLLLGASGWRSACAQMVVDVALISDRDADLDIEAMSRPVSWVDGEVRVGHLRREPYRNDVWLLQATDPPLSFRQVDLLPSTAPASPAGAPAPRALAPLAQAGVGSDGHRQPIT